MTTNNIPTHEQIADIVWKHLTSVYVCNRVWEAWSYGTMGPDDFVEASETEMADEIAAAVLERFGQRYMPAKLCDCEQSHNGMGMSGRVCDCSAMPAAEWQDEMRMLVLEYGNLFADSGASDQQRKAAFIRVMEHARRRIEGE